jgi:nucleoside-diphosphate-sugar epimerase
MTIPPLLKNPETEVERLHIWGKWMSHNRPEIKRMIYISTTGVYPKLNGIWSEDSNFEADTNSGNLRLLTENILSKYFSLHVVRPGGIYGYGRGIDVRLKSGKPIPVSNTPVHRIHVKDLARIICHLVDNPDSPNCVNAVDLEAKPSWEVAKWLFENRDDLTEEMLPDAADCLPGTPQRVISNERLLELGITLSYPTFREGMGLMFEN